jgi:hypothetical protein
VSVRLARVMQARRYTGPGVIVQGGREIKVTCFYEVRSGGAGVEWHGEFREAPPDREPEPGGAQFRVDGKVARIAIVAVTAGIGRGRFTGNGSPPG